MNEHFELQISTSKLNFFRVTLTNKVKSFLIPLLLTEGQVKTGIEKLKEIDFKDLPFDFVKMIICGCFVTIMQRE